MAQCITPFTKNGYHLPCGKCYECKARRISAWSFRLSKQAEVSTSAYFLTLTYDTPHLPRTNNNLQTICKRDLQLFFKRLRKLQLPGTIPIKYYACGEYGSITKRPHYHIILFNATIESIEKSWQLGQYHVGDVTPASTGYTLKYISKKTLIPQFKRDDRIPEFSLMSKKMGINYITKNTLKWHKKDLLNRMYCPLKDGKKIAMPKYFKEKIYNILQRNMIAQHIANQELKKDLGKTLITLDAEFKQKQLILLNKFNKNNNDTRINPTI